TLTSAMLGAKMRGFQRPGQDDVLRPFRQPYFDHLLPMWEERTLEVAVSYARAMYPSFLIEDDTIGATDEYLERGGVPGPIRRTLIEARDQVVRAMRARECDRGWVS